VVIGHIVHGGGRCCRRPALVAVLLVGEQRSNHLLLLGVREWDRRDLCDDVILFFGYYFV
jgi:hypothetical protein